MLFRKLQCVVISLFVSSGATLVALCYFLKNPAHRHHATVWEIMAALPQLSWSAWTPEFARPALAAFGLGILCLITMLAIIWPSSETQTRRLDSKVSIQSLLRLSSEKQPRLFAGRYGKEPLYVSAEDRALVIGPPGTGKTSFLINQILQASEAELNFVAVDFKPELHKLLSSALEKKGYRVLRINPCRHDANADHWNPLDEVSDALELQELVTALLPSTSADNEPFVQAQRDWVNMVAMHLKTTDPKRATLPQVLSLLTRGDAISLAGDLTQSRSSYAQRNAKRTLAGLKAKKPDPLIASGLSSAARNLDYFGIESIHDALGYSSFRIAEIGRDPRPTALFLQFEETRITALGPLMAFMMTAVINRLIANHDKRKPVALFLDEVGNFPPIPQLSQKLNTIRSRMLPTWLYFQTIHQIDARYGPGAINTFFAAASLRMCFRLDDEKSRDTFSILIGETVHEKTTISTNTEADRGVTTTKSEQQGEIIAPGEIGRLKDGEIICLYKDATAKGVGTPYFVDFPEYRR